MTKATLALVSISLVLLVTGCSKKRLAECDAFQATIDNSCKTQNAAIVETYSKLAPDCLK